MKRNGSKAERLNAKEKRRKYRAEVARKSGSRLRPIEITATTLEEALRPLPSAKKRSPQNIVASALKVKTGVKLKLPTAVSKERGVTRSKKAPSDTRMADLISTDILPQNQRPHLFVSGGLPSLGKRK